MSALAKVQQPRLWLYLLGALIALIILIPVWTLFVMLEIQPESLMTQEQTMNQRLLWWVAGPVAAVAVICSTNWMMASRNAQAREHKLQKQKTQEQQAHASAQSKREYVLEVIGMGVTLDKYRQGKLWEVLQKGSPYTTIREQDEKKYPWSAQEKSGISGGRGGDSLENGAQYTPMYYGVPVFNAEPPIIDPTVVDKPNDPNIGLADGAVLSGMAWHLFVAGPRRFDEHPDHILEDVFSFFDANPDVPYIILNSDDSMEFRDSNRVRGTPRLLKDGYYIPEMPDASALFVLARRERVEVVRPFVFADAAPEKSVFYLNQYGVARRLFLAYAALERTVPKYDPDIVKRPPLISEWLPIAAAFAQRPDIRGTGSLSLLNDLSPRSYHAPTDWKPTPWFPVPWNRDQLADFDRLPTLGFIHRPTFVKLTDEHGKPLMRRDEREKALQDGWRAALLNLPEAERAKGPSRIIGATGGNVNHLIALRSTLNDYVAHGGPEFDSGKSTQFIDTDKRLGNTGACTLFMQMAIGVMGSYRDGGVSAAINLRDDHEASIVFISPPSDARRAEQQHPDGGDVFGHHVEPAIDPANYPPN